MKIETDTCCDWNEAKQAYIYGCFRFMSKIKPILDCMPALTFSEAVYKEETSV